MRRGAAAFGDERVADDVGVGVDRAGRYGDAGRGVRRGVGAPIRQRQRRETPPPRLHSPGSTYPRGAADAAPQAAWVLK
jgi:hypothetical protein